MSKKLALKSFCSPLFSPHWAELQYTEMSLLPYLTLPSLPLLLSIQQHVSLVSGLLSPIPQHSFLFEEPLHTHTHTYTHAHPLSSTRSHLYTFNCPITPLQLRLKAPSLLSFYWKWQWPCFIRHGHVCSCVCVCVFEIVRWENPPQPTR